MSDRLPRVLEEAGQFGPFQWRLSAVSVFIIFMYSLRICEYMFTTTRIPTRCVIKECDDPDVTQFTPAWLGRAVPTIDGDFDNCHRYARAANTTANNDTSCPAELFDTNSIVPCESYVYENHDSVVYDFNLACDEWHRTLIGSLRMFGMLMGMPLMGFTSDRWGRRPTLIANEFIAGCLGVIRYWSTSYGGYNTLVLIESIFNSSQFNCIFVLVMETVGTKYRGITASILKMSFSLGLILLTLLAWLVRNWHTLTLVMYVPALLVCCYFWMVPESIRWNLSKGNYDAAEATLKKVAQMNGKKLSQQSLRELRQAAEEERLEKDTESEPWLVVQVFRSKPILIRSLVLPVLWISLMMIFFGLSANTTNLFGNMYLNFMLVFAAEIPGCLLAMVLMYRADRRHTLSAAFIVCAACQIAYIVMPKGMVVTTLIVYMIGKMCIAVVIVVLYAFTTELFPTRYRQNLFNFCACVGKIGGVVAPITPVFAFVWKPLPYVLFAAQGVLSGLLVLVLPETRGTVLPDTMQQAAHLTRTPHPRGAEDLSLMANSSPTQ